MALDDIIGNSSGNIFIRPSLFMVSTTCTGMADITASQELDGGLLIKWYSRSSIQRKKSIPSNPQTIAWRHITVYYVPQRPRLA